jgi:hypothetical protein
LVLDVVVCESARNEMSFDDLHTVPDVKVG